MNPAIRLDGLARFLTAIYGEQTDLPAMLDGLGFDAGQSRLLREQQLQAVAAAFVEAVRRKLTSGDKDLWFRLLSRRYGLDGEPAASLEETARALTIDLSLASKAQTDALEKCRYKTTLQDLRKELHRIALAELSKSGERPQKEAVARKLKRLADLHAALDLTRMDYDAKRLEILKKVQAELDALESEYQPLLNAAQENAAALEAEIKNDVLLGGESVVTDVFQALYVKGRVSWDNEGLGNYAHTHPEVLIYRKEGQPNVTLRAVGKASDK